MRLSKIHIFILICFSGLLFNTSCKPEAQHPIPDVYVNFTININDDPEFYRLRFPNNLIVVTNSTFGYLSLGYNNNGIVVYNEGDGEFVAFDRTCPHDMPKSVIVDSEPSSSVMECPECGSRYVLSSMGAPSLDSPSRWPLKEYPTFYNPNTGDITVVN